MANIISATIFGANGNDWNDPSGVEMGFPTKNVVFKGIKPTQYSGIICNSQIQVLPTAPSPIQQIYYTDEIVSDLITASNSSEFPSVNIGSQIWMTKNWDGTTFQNGDPIPEVQDQAAWDALSTPAWCYYDNDSANGAIYGKLYKWYAVNDIRGFAPTGWKVPTLSDFTVLETSLGGLIGTGGSLKETGLTYWIAPNTGATNSTGFSGYGGGYRQTGGFTDLQIWGVWWLNTDTGGAGETFNFRYDSNDIFQTNYPKEFGFSVRLLKDI